MHQDARRGTNLAKGHKATLTEAHALSSVERIRHGIGRRTNSNRATYIILGAGHMGQGRWAHGRSDRGMSTNQAQVGCVHQVRRWAWHTGQLGVAWHHFPHWA
ncbi:hypothetical protein TanjilG_19710 [Lupinus angustifolius]|uniref:Uncharacterized protein n=1 Tax=Lupinus angustifolius TaxID=3871 RepID=A0A4P1RAI8_LUPAN|nr:hypothetical protein TanjilG_19710 [Lupinus angustifolius]